MESETDITIILSQDILNIYSFREHFKKGTKFVAVGKGDRINVGGDTYDVIWPDGCVKNPNITRASERIRSIVGDSLFDEMRRLYDDCVRNFSSSLHSEIKHSRLDILGTYDGMIEGIREYHGKNELLSHKGKFDSGKARELRKIVSKIANGISVCLFKSGDTKSLEYSVRFFVHGTDCYEPGSGAAFSQSVTSGGRATLPEVEGVEFRVALPSAPITEMERGNVGFFVAVFGDNTYFTGSRFVCCVC
ncbi:MAG TPA: hypothetical protein DCO86_05560 [Spirochaetaceae bacterium]|nr:hypothetical protein [Spirochaetaceae bacterium]